MPPELLLLIDLDAVRRARLEATYVVHQARKAQERQAAITDKGHAVQAVVTNGVAGITAAEIAALPRLGIICCMGAGYEGVDLAAARARGINVTHGPGTNDACVADHTMALLLAVLRDIPRFDRAVREGGWRSSDAMRPAANGKRLGILGLGNIGSRIARRASAFDMSIAYHNRRARPDLPYSYYDTPLALAHASDCLVCVLPGGAATRHLVDAAVLDALGPSGFLVNVGRGGVVDTTALIDALGNGQIAGAALDVFEGEPAVPEALRSLPNVVLTPHVAGRSPESLENTISLVLRNLAAYFAGDPVPTPVPSTA